MRREKSKSKPVETKSEDKPKQDSSEIIKQLPAIIGAIATLLTALAGVLVALNQAGLISFSASPTPTASFTPTSTLTVTLIPTDTPSPTSTLTPTETLTPTPTATETPVPIPTAGAICPWLPYSTLNPALKIGKNCLNDLLSLGISQTAEKILFYRESA